jgi:hypothetical protein
MKSSSTRNVIEPPTHAILALMWLNSLSVIRKIAVYCFATTVMLAQPAREKVRGVVMPVRPAVFV